MAEISASGYKKTKQEATARGYKKRGWGLGGREGGGGGVGGGVGRGKKGNGGNQGKQEENQSNTRNLDARNRCPWGVVKTKRKAESKRYQEWQRKDRSPKTVNRGCPKSKSGRKSTLGGKKRGTKRNQEETKGQGAPWAHAGEGI